ncbi:MAG: hemolysin family protein [Clostridiales bacterium]|nr:hemolysin family protein [Clostridiales bacterium]
MEDGSRLPWVITVVLLLCAAYFAVAETAAASASRVKIKSAAERGSRGATDALYVLDNFDRAVTTLLICTNAVHITASTIVTVEVTRIWGLGAVSVSTIITTFVVFFAGEMLPKSIAKKYSERLLLACSTSLCFLMKVLAPVSSLLTAAGQAAARFSKEDPQISVTEDELYDIIEDMAEEGTLNDEQSDLISSALQFGDVTVESVLTPRVDVVAVDIDAPLSEIVDVVKAQNHSRLPVYEDSIDNIIGVLQIRKFIKAYLREGESLEIRPMLEDALFVHQSTYIDDLLPSMSKRRLNMAIVTDNYGGTLGIVTIEDILEELVGEIWDEDDVVDETIVRLDDHSWQVDADESVTDVFEQIDFEDPEENEELLNTRMGEWAYEQFTGIPEVGDAFTYHEIQVTVSDMERNRIRKLTLTLLPSETEGGEEQ